MPARQKVHETPISTNKLGTSYHPSYTGDVVKRLCGLGWPRQNCKTLLKRQLTQKGLGGGLKWQNA
jgi:hypothetical protein